MDIGKWLKWIWSESVTDHIVASKATSSRLLPTTWSSQGYDFRPVRSDDIEQITKSFPALDQAKIRERIHSGDYGAIALKSGEVVGFCWASTKARPFEGEKPLQYTIAPKNGTGYMYDANVIPTERGNSVGTNVIATVVRQLHHDNIFQIFYTHNAGYDPMARITQTLGFKKTGTLKYKRILCFWSRDVADLSSYSTT